MNEEWDCIDESLPPTEQVAEFERLTQEKLNQFCPEKTMKISSQDKVWITEELKKIHRLKSREYIKHGKSVKYKSLSKEFLTKFKLESQKYMQKQMNELKETNPGRAFRILKKMGAMPGDCSGNNNFTLPGHEEEGLSAEQSAERIAQHFAQISQQFPPLNINTLPDRVRNKLSNRTSPPQIEDYEVYNKIKYAHKPQSGVPGDLPRLITKEFAPELAKPIRKIISSIAISGEWPTQWKLESVSAIGKIPIPETEDDLRPLSLTSFFSKVAEHFVVMWLLSYIGQKIDFRQYGGTKRNSITHYLIEFINFILTNQDDDALIAIIACMVDFAKLSPSSSSSWTELALLSLFPSSIPSRPKPTRKSIQIG